MDVPVLRSEERRAHPCALPACPGGEREKSLGRAVIHVHAMPPAQGKRKKPRANPVTPYQHSLTDFRPAT
jgi:hypothetical protein